MSIVLVSVWIGSIIFFSSIIAPTVFKSLDEKSAGLFLRAFFPKYYVFGIIIGVLAIVIDIKSHDNLAFLLIGSMIVLSFISRGLIPMINNARDMGDTGKDKFKKLHTFSVVLNVVTLLIGLVYIYNSI
ncbi:MAG: hypothetical protein CMD43_04105 [Gammaproteobacteria bacterium]|nr:hypothetical protein [Gammaproteobacteria bacterium]|tara:strand:- start:262 stop:648 length:387 start_codon:yes stop_codon:yes gene_type:complete